MNCSAFSFTAFVMRCAVLDILTHSVFFTSPLPALLLPCQGLIPPRQKTQGHSNTENSTCIQSATVTVFAWPSTDDDLNFDGKISGKVKCLDHNVSLSLPDTGPTLRGVG